jgi:hypothetical protein
LWEEFVVFFGAKINDQEVERLHDLLCVHTKVPDFVPVAQVDEEVSAEGQQEVNHLEEVFAATHDISAKS